MQSKSSKVTRLKFGEMTGGQWFRELNGPRVMVKLQSVLPSGWPQTHARFAFKQGTQIPGTCSECNDFLRSQGNIKQALTMNAIDTLGIACFCPEWLEFELIDNPFPDARNVIL